MHVLFADSVDESGLAPLRAAGHTVTVDPSLSVEDLAAHVVGVDVLVVRSTKVTADVVEAADRLAMVVRAGAGTDTIDVSAAAANGVYVCNVPGRNAVAVAELTMALLLAIDRRIVDGATDLRAGQWNKSEYKKADGVAGKTMGIIGLGAIGRAVARRAVAFDLRVIGLHRQGRSAEAEAELATIGVELVATQDELLARADIVSVHVPGGDQTDQLVDATFLAAMKPDAILLNTSRGSTLDGDALLHALNTTGLRAGLDVYPNEPSGGTGDFVSELASHPRVVGSHHVGASTEQAQRSVAAGTVEVIEAFARGEIINCVNMEHQQVGAALITVRHRDEVGVLAQVFEILRQAGINVQQMRNEVFRGGRAAVAIIGVDPCPTDAVLDRLTAVPEILGLECVVWTDG